MDLNNPCYNELYKTYETERLFLERTKEMDYPDLAEIMFNNREINIDYQRPALYLENIEKSKEFIKSQSTNSVSFTIKLKNENRKGIGQIGFYYTNQSCIEIGIFYYIDKNYQKKGYAGEAACPLIRHLFENLPCTISIKIDYNESNIGSKKIADKICADILKYHPNYTFGTLIPFIDTYTLLSETEDGKAIYCFEGYDRKCQVTYPLYFFNRQNYFEKVSNGVFIMKDN